MSYTKVPAYTDAQLLQRVSKLPGFQGFPAGYWILGVRSKADTYDVYDDKFYIFKATTFIDVMTGSTNAGAYGIKNFAEWDKRGVAHIKADEWYYEVWTRGKHKAKVEALVQTDKPFKVYRDKDKDKKLGNVDPSSWTWEAWRGLNFHPNSYNLATKVINWFIGGWSTGCQVVNDVQKYKKFLDYTRGQNKFSYCLINEF